MPVNQYFNNYNYSREQNLIESLVIESIKMYGHEMKYLPKTIVRKDPLFGEDTLMKFDDAIGIEMYIKNIENFEGEGTFLSKFNLEIRDQITFTVARKRFDQARSEKLTTEVGYNYLLETANTTSPSRQFLTTSYEGDSIILEDGTGDGYSITSERPMEGDLLYFPLVRKIFEIKYVEHEAIFYQTGRLQTYDLKCELYTYSSERFETGNTEIDLIQGSYSTDILTNEFLLEDGFVLLLENGGSVMQEYRVEDTQPTANNEYYSLNDPVFGVDSIIDFSESNPFVIGGKY